MYKIVLIDDEKFVLYNLLNSVDWEKMGFSVVASFFDSLKALQFIRENVVDAVITDVKMPRLSGIDLAKMLSKEHPEIKIVILSGYDDFEYAREAIECNVFKYLLKPVGLTEIDNMLSSLKEKLKNDRIDKLDKENKNIDTMVLQKIISDFQRKKIDLPTALKEFDNHGVHLKRNTAVAIFKIYLQDLEEYLKNIFNYGIQRLYMALEWIIRKCDIPVIPTSYTFDCVECIALSDTENVSEFIGKLKEECNDFISNCFELLNLSIAIQYKTVSNQLIYMREDDECENIVAELFLLIKNSGSIKKLKSIESLSSQQSRCADVLNMLIGKLLSEELNKFEQKINNEKIEYLLSFYSCNKVITLECIMAFLNRFKEIDHKEENTDDKKCDETINRIKEYVNKNYAYGISLVNIASQFNINPSYLSRYFKKKTGEKYIDYLNRIRIERAEQMLRNSNKKIAEIAQFVGYQDVKYFYKVFKKLKGVTPQILRSGQDKENFDT